MEWTPVTWLRFVAFTAAVVLLGYAEMRPPIGWVPWLDGANLMFHEAGHPIFGLFGQTMGLYGGTIGQLVLPLVAVIEFWRKRATMSFAVACLWFFQNFFNIARYVADARAQVLPLVGGGEHDWWHILSRWDALKYDVTIALIITSIGIAGIVAIWFWLALRLFFKNHEAAESL